tara:strand:- start:877 stop:2361 length:1485 start_codon:yes stop_codon:yes gene_type:complete
MSKKKNSQIIKKLYSITGIFYNQIFEMDILLETAVNQAAAIKKGDLSPIELISMSLDRIDYVQREHNPFTVIFEKEAKKQAKQAEELIASGVYKGPLHGLPVVIKDFTPTKGHLTTLGSITRKNWVPNFNPTIVKRLISAGAIIIAKSTTPEFAHASFTHSNLWGVTTNPWDITRTPGGSSGGSAVAVTTGCASLAEGTDMGGSVRIPAAYCGCVGLKPSLGRIPMDILKTSFDNISHFGPLARSVEDAAMFLKCVEGASDSDIQSQKYFPKVPEKLNINPKNFKIASSLNLGFYAVDTEVQENFLNICNEIRSLGTKVDEIKINWSLEHNEAWLKNWEVFLAAHFGEELKENKEFLDPEVVELIERGLDARAVDIKKLEFVKSQQWQELSKVFANYDALICPTMPTIAPFHHLRDSDFSKIDDDGTFHGIDMTALFNNVPQCPAISVPSGISKFGLPTAVQIIGQRFDDLTTLSLAKLVMDNTKGLQLKYKTK